MKDFVGNSRLVEFLERHGLPQASLFSGPEGVGKKTLALSLAGGANCENSDHWQPCRGCPSCLRAEVGHHPDILLYEPSKNLIRIEAMRHLSREAQFRPFEGKIRVFIVDGADTMTEEAANSILKTIEEPPPTSHIVLVTALPQSLLPTIRSRCQHFFFRPLERDEIHRYLQRKGDHENSETRAAFAQGSIGRALNLNLEETLRDRDLMLELLGSWCKEESFHAIYSKCEEAPLRQALKTREGVRGYLHQLQKLGEDLYFLQVETPERVVNQDRLGELTDLSEILELKWVRHFLYHIQQSMRDIDRYLNPLICFETLWLLNSRRQTDAGNSYRQV